MGARKKKKRWIAGAIERPGAFTAKAKKAKMGVQEFARHVRAHKERYSARTVKQANLAITLSKMRKRRKRRRAS